MLFRSFWTGLRDTSPEERPLPRFWAGLGQLLAILGILGTVALGATAGLGLFSALFEAGGWPLGLAALPLAWLSYGGVYLSVAVAGVSGAVSQRAGARRRPLVSPAGLDGRVSAALSEVERIFRKPGCTGGPGLSNSPRRRTRVSGGGPVS